jgi:hypothetical protein
MVKSAKSNPAREARCAVESELRRSLVDGRIWSASSLGEGSTFFVFLASFLWLHFYGR